MKTSESIKDIASALLKVQRELANPPRTGVANVKSRRTGAQFSYKYVPLDKLLEHVKAVACKHDVAFIQSASAGVDGTASVVTRLIHEGGEWIESDPLIIAGGEQQEGPQYTGSGITYGRRYQLEAMFGLCGEDDDDAQRAANRAASNGQAQQGDGGSGGDAEDEEKLRGKRLEIVALLKRLAGEDADNDKLADALQAHTRSDNFNGWRSVKAIKSQKAASITLRQLNDELRRRGDDHDPNADPAPGEAKKTLVGVRNEFHDACKAAGEDGKEMRQELLEYVGLKKVGDLKVEHYERGITMMKERKAANEENPPAGADQEDIVF